MVWVDEKQAHKLFTENCMSDVLKQRNALGQFGQGPFNQGSFCQGSWQVLCHTSYPWPTMGRY
jgi:hypothetical protein